MYRPSSAATWSHTPTATTLAWLAFSLPLVAWDSVYVLLRPHTMPGGALHWPFFVPYKLYGTVDHMYGPKAWDAGVGFTGAQGLLNVVESAMYLAYLWAWYAEGEGEGWKKQVAGRKGGVMVLVGFGAAVMTLSKTVLYCKFFFLPAWSTLLDSRRQTGEEGKKERRDREGEKKC